MPKAKEKVRLSKKQQSLVENVVDVLDGKKTLNKKELLRKSGYTGTTIENPSQVFSSDNIALAFHEAGLTPAKMSTVLTEAQEAKKGTFVQGEYIESDKADHDVRLKSLNLQADILGLKKQVIEQKSINVHVKAEDLPDLF